VPDKENSGRAGTFMAQGRGVAAYHAFVPKPLPPEPELNMDGRLRELHEQASTAVGRLDGAWALLPNADHLLWIYIRKEAVLSSQIEDTQSSLTDLLLHENARAPSVPLDDVAEVSSYVRAMVHGIELLRNKLPLSLRLIREIHAELVKGTRGADKTPGEFRRSQNWIGGSGPGNARFVPPPPDAVMPALDNLEKFLHDQPQRTSPLIKAGLAHAQFETIHPFLDGNGRVGRLLITMILLNEGVLKEPALYMSLHFKQNRQEYYERLQRVRTHGDWEGWMDFYLDGLASVAGKATAMIGQIHALMSKDRSMVGARGGSIYQSAAAQNNLQVYELLCQHLMLSVPRAAAELGLSPPTVRRVLNDMKGWGLIEEITGKKRNQIFLYRRFLDLLEDGA
jgi:Fic family protein